MIYRSELKLDNQLLPENLDEAKEYLLEDNMLDYFDNENLSKKLNSIKWILEDVSGGYYEIDSSEELTKEELEEITEFIQSQNLDGLGEGFSQQDFAWLDDDNYAIIEDPEEWRLI